MYEKLFSPVRIGCVEIKNRVAMTAMGVNLAAVGGGVNDDIIAFYEARAKRVKSPPGTLEICRDSSGSWTRCTNTAPKCSSSCTIRAATMDSAASSPFPRLGGRIPRQRQGAARAYGP